MALRNMPLRRAQRYLENVKRRKKSCRSFAIMEELDEKHNVSNGTPPKVAGPRSRLSSFSTLLKNAESNAEYKGLDVDHLVVDHIVVQRAAKCDDEPTVLMDGSIVC
ncbi:hypothetical protein KIN20_029732 [Parelaphostrongylus tenuis]|uniref:Large ribosomal subunit protein uL22 n=1 Tax=Parelaphostrongylus tenuis TaxID=148309 RepID=A0AAD5R2W4_PARTN|nr:hypothetical protein KIN20_029732 [Parelaphostrongylus tenuis]